MFSDSVATFLVYIAVSVEDTYKQLMSPYSLSQP